MLMWHGPSGWYKRGVSKREWEWVKRRELSWKAQTSKRNWMTKGIRKEELRGMMKRWRKKKVVDFRYPHKWYPMARMMKREVHLHVGPTNSGKTHAGLERLRNAKSGVYCAPLRLLAEQVYESMNQEGVKCDLITGEKKVEANEGMKAQHVSCTIEMVDLTTKYECALVDEYQLLGDESRGWAWTRAILGLYAKEIHLCGDTSSIELVEKMLEPTGDRIVIHQYERLSPLEVAKNPLQKDWIQDLRSGDAVIVFSRKDIYRVKQHIEYRLKRPCSVIYGNLPPESRQQQASAFNSAQTDILVATDAIGLGLNLNIRRIIFLELNKYDGKIHRQLNNAEIRQIAGRAGRYQSRYPCGEVTSPYESICKIVRNAISSPVEPVLRAGLFPSLEHLERIQLKLSTLLPSSFFLFSSKHHSYLSLSTIFNVYERSACISGNYFLCDSSIFRFLASSIDHLPLSLQHKYIFSTAPVPIPDPISLFFFKRFASDFSNHSVTSVPLPLPDRIYSLLPSHSTSSLLKWETTYKITDLYLWLSLRLPKFSHHLLASSLKRNCESVISSQILFQSLLSTSRLNRNHPSHPSKKITYHPITPYK